MIKYETAHSKKEIAIEILFSHIKININKNKKMRDILNEIMRGIYIGIILLLITELIKNIVCSGLDELSTLSIVLTISNIFILSHLYVDLSEN